MRKTCAAILTVALLVSMLAVSPLWRAAAADLESASAVEFILGPQVPIAGSWFDQTQIERAKVHGAACPAIPPANTDAQIIADGNLTTSFNLLHYYDLALALYIAHRRTGDPTFLNLARKCADSWWLHPQWIQAGAQRDFDNGKGPAPRHAGLGGLMLRALDGRPEMWDWIVAYTRHQFDNWLKRRINNAQLYYGVREGAFMLHNAVWLAKALPDSYPNAAQIRAQFMTDVEAVSVNYFGRLQQADGSWRWDDFDFVDSDGGTLKGITQPFMVGLTLAALVDVHRASTNETAKTSIQNQITKACRHLYSGGPYLTQLVPSLGVGLRGFAYFYHGGTTVNPTKYEKGNYPANWDTRDPGEVQNARQAIGPIIAAYGYAYKLTNDLFFRTAGDELWDAAYGETDKIRNYMAGDAKSFNQNGRRAASYLAWSATPTPTPTPTPAPTPAPTPTPTPAPTPTATQTPTLPRVAIKTVSTNLTKRAQDINAIETSEGMKLIGCSDTICYFARRP